MRDESPVVGQPSNISGRFIPALSGWSTTREVTGFWQGSFRLVTESEPQSPRISLVGSKTALTIHPSRLFDDSVKLFFIWGYPELVYDPYEHCWSP